MLRFVRPVLPSPSEWIPHLEESYRQRRFTNFGPTATRLEQALAETYGQGREVVLTASATTGLTAALLALGVRGRVALPAFTFPATACAIRLAACEPVFCDVAPDTWEIDPAALTAAHRAQKLAAIIAVRAFGLCRDLEPVNALAQAWQIPLIVDSAAALGGRLARGAFVGNQGAVEVFSMHATKAFGVGEGGALFAPADWVPAIRQACNFGLQDGEIRRPGLNGKMSEFHAAVGLALLPHFPAHVARRRSVTRRYRRLAAELPGAAAAMEPGWPVWQTFPLLLPANIDADQFVAAVATSGVEIRRYYRPALSPLPVSEDLARRMVCLPVYSDMAPSEIDAVIEAVRRAWKQQSGHETNFSARAG